MVIILRIVIAFTLVGHGIGHIMGFIETWTGWQLFPTLHLTNLHGFFLMAYSFNQLSERFWASSGYWRCSDFSPRESA